MITDSLLDPVSVQAAVDALQKHIETGVGSAEGIWQSFAASTVGRPLELRDDRVEEDSEQTSSAKQPGEDAGLKKYKLMQRARIPEFVIRHKMEMAGIEEAEIDRFFAPQEEVEQQEQQEPEQLAFAECGTSQSPELNEERVAAAAAAAAALSTNGTADHNSADGRESGESIKLKKYRLMQRARIPDFVIRHKMEMAEIEQAEIDRFFSAAGCTAVGAAAAVTIDGTNASGANASSSSATPPLNHSAIGIVTPAPSSAKDTDAKDTDAKDTDTKDTDTKASSAPVPLCGHPKSVPKPCSPSPGFGAQLIKGIGASAQAKGGEDEGADDSPLTRSFPGANKPALRMNPLGGLGGSGGGNFLDEMKAMAEKRAKRAAANEEKRAAAEANEAEAKAEAEMKVREAENMKTEERLRVLQKKYSSAKIMGCVRGGNGDGGGGPKGDGKGDGDVEGEGETSLLFDYNMLRVDAVDGSRASALLGEGRHAEVLRAVLRMAKARSIATPAKNAAKDARQGISVGEHIEPAEFKRFGIMKRGGVNEFAIRHKMEMAGIEEAEIDRFFAPQEEVADEVGEVVEEVVEEMPVLEASEGMYLSSDDEEEGEEGEGAMVAAKIFKHARQGVGNGTPPPQVVDNFVHELRVLATIAAPAALSNRALRSPPTRLHPNLLRFFGASFSPQLCLLTEYLPMGSLVDFMLKEGGRRWADTVGPSERIRLASEAVAGLAHLHCVGVMHRDIKGHNVLLHMTPHTAGRSGSETCGQGGGQIISLKLADFGSAKIFTGARDDRADPGDDRAYTVVGTSGYTAPEVYENCGKGYSYPADVWSLGVLMAELMHDIRCTTSTSSAPSATLANPLVGVEATLYYEALKSGTRVPLPQSSCLEKLTVSTSAPAYPGSSTSISSTTTAHEQMAGLIGDCWAWEPDQRPDLEAISGGLMEMAPPGER
jgi:serine/threonine protein kinase